MRRFGDDEGAVDYESEDDFSQTPGMISPPDTPPESESEDEDEDDAGLIDNTGFE